MLAFQAPPEAVIAPVRKYGKMPGSMTRFHHSQPLTRKLRDASRRSLGNADAPAITLNNIYHCVPRIISGDSQISGLAFQKTISDTTSGNRRLLGKAARNCATG